MIDHEKYFSIAKYFIKYNDSIQKYTNKVLMEIASFQILFLSSCKIQHYTRQTKYYSEFCPFFKKVHNFKIKKSA